MKKYSILMSIHNESSYISALFKNLHTENRDIIINSIKMAAKNSSMKKDSMSDAYARKVSNIFNIVEKLESIEKEFGTAFIAILGRAMHNITYLNGPLIIKFHKDIDGITVLNEYNKLGQKRTLRRLTKVEI